MDRDDGEGAAAAAEYFIELYPYIMATGDTAEFEAMSHEECGFCRDALTAAHANLENNYSYVGGDVSVKVLKTYDSDSLTGIVPIDVQVEQTKSLTLDRSGTEISSSPSETNISRIEVGIEGDLWVVIEIAPRPEE